MKIDENILTKLEKLSSLKIENKDEMIDELNKIVGFMENLSAIDTTGVDTVFSLNNTAAKLREDIAISNTDIKEQILDDAPSARDSFFVVPKIIG